MKKPYTLDRVFGYGISPETKGNAIALEGSPNVRRYAAEYPSSQLGASGMSVGLPDGQMGNSEGRAPEHGRRPHRLSGADQDHEGDPRRRVFPQ